MRTRMQFETTVFFFAASFGLGACGSCQGEKWRGPGDGEAPAANASASASSAASAPLPQLTSIATAHPRILLTPARLANLKKLDKAGNPAMARLTKRCDEATDKTIDSGYEAWDWTNAALSCALLWRVTGNDARAKTALKYLKALLDDRMKVGDGKGGLEVVRHDSGYPIRTFGFGGAIAYDWLHGAPGMTDDMKKAALDRFTAWVAWFKENGYQKDKPIANYYAGYFGTVGMAGVACEGDDPRGAELRKTAQAMWKRSVVPEMKKLQGGQWPEGWQYGGLAAAVFAIYADTEKVAGDLVFLREMVDYRRHSLWPDAVHVYDNGDWSKKPATANGHEMWGALVALPAGDPFAARARALAKMVKPERDNQWTWLEAIVEDPSAPTEEPDPKTTSYLAKGTGTAFARSAWSPGAVWASINAGPYLSDHQHLDQGHFEIVRGTDALLVDGGGYGAGSSASHNTLLVDDGGETMTYTPNQTAESSGSSIARFEDQGSFVYALADFGAAYDPAKFKEDGRRAVARAEREWIFSRTPAMGSEGSARLVLYDRVTLTKGSYGVSWAGHTFGDAKIAGPLTTYTAGKSVAFATTLLPRNVTPTSLQEPQSKDKDSFWLNNDPPEGLKSTRVEVASPKGDQERRFLHAIVVGDPAVKPPPALGISGEGVDGAAIRDEAYLFVKDAPQKKAAKISYRAPSEATRHIVAGLAPGERYALEAKSEGGACKVTLSPGGDKAASKAGVLVLEAPCK
jgi:Heparinase II/III-like protein